MPTPTRTGGHRILKAAAGNPVSLSYLAVCLGLLVWVAVDATLVQHQDASLAGAVPVLATAPTSLAVVLVPEGSAVGYFLVTGAAALVNATLLGLVAERLRRSRKAAAHRDR